MAKCLRREGLALVSTGRRTHHQSPVEKETPLTWPAAGSELLPRTCCDLCERLNSGRRRDGGLPGSPARSQLLGSLCVDPLLRCQERRRLHSPKPGGETRPSQSGAGCAPRGSSVPVKGLTVSCPRWEAAGGGSGPINPGPPPSCWGPGEHGSLWKHSLEFLGQRQRERAVRNSQHVPRHRGCSSEPAARSLRQRVRKGLISKSGLKGWSGQEEDMAPASARPVQLGER